MEELIEDTTSGVEYEQAMKKTPMGLVAVACIGLGLLMAWRAEESNFWARALIAAAAFGMLAAVWVARN